MAVKLYDSWGQEITPNEKPDERTLATASLRDRWSMYPSNGLTPQTLASIFKEADLGNVWRQAELFEEMEEKDTHLFSVIQTRKLAITGLDFEIEPASEDAQDQKIAEFIQEVINDLSDFEGNLSDLLDAIGKGYSLMEIYWDVRNNKNIARHIEWVHAKRITWYNNITPRLITEEKPYEGIEIPPFKMIFHLHKARSGHSNRQGILRTVAWMYLFKNYTIKDWVAFAEVFGMPLRLGKYDVGALPDDRKALYEAVRALGRDAAGVISKSTEIEFIEASKNSGENIYETLAMFCNSEISKAILGHSASSDSTPGKLGNENMAGGIRKDLLISDCEMVAKTLRRDLIRPLVGFNFGWDVSLPWFKFHYEEPQDLDAEANKIKTLSDAGVTSIPVSWVHEKFNIPLPKDGEETIHSTIKNPENQLTKMKVGQFSGQNKSNLVDKVTVDALTNGLHSSISVDNIINDVKAIMAEPGITVQKAMERIADKYKGNMTDFEKVVMIIKNYLIASKLKGMIDVAAGG